MSTRRTVGQTIKAACRKCLSLDRPQDHGYDCLGKTCPLYPGMPYRGKAPTKTLQPDGQPVYEAERMVMLAREIPKRRPTKTMLRRQCRMCVPDKDPYTDREIRDCEHNTCPLFPWRPMQPGGMPKTPSLVAAAKRRRRISIFTPRRRTHESAH
jgi:hypothetical protein